MRSSSSSSSSRARPKVKDGFLLGPRIYNDTTDEANTDRSANQSFTDHSSPVPEIDSINFHTTNSTSSSGSSKKKSILKKGHSKAQQTPKRSRSIVEDSSDEAAQQQREADLRREKSDYEKRRRDKLIELAKQAEKDQEKLLQQRTIAEQEAREIEKSVGMEENFRKKSMAKMKGQIEGMDWRTNREVRDVRRELEEWKQKTAMSGELAARVDSVEQRVAGLEKADAERKKTMEQVEKNWADFGRLKTQSMALEVTQIKNRRGAAHLARMPKDVAEGTSKNLYKLCADLHRLTFHLNSKSPLINLVDEALVLAEAIAPLFGAKEEFIDSRETTSTTNVSLSNVSIATSSGASSAESSSTNSSAESSSKSPSKKLTAPVRSSLRRVGKNPVAVSIPPLSKFVPNYSLREHLFIDAPSLREKSSNYYSDKEFISLSKEAANCEPTPIVPQAAPVEASATPGPAPPMEPPAAPVAVPPPAAPVATPLPAPDAPLAPAPEAVSSPAPVAVPQLPVEAPAAAAVVPTVAEPELPVEAPAEVAAAAPVAAPPPATAPAAAPEQQPAAPTEAPAAAAVDVAPQPDAPSAASVSISDSDITSQTDKKKKKKKKGSSRRSSKESKEEPKLE